MYTVSISIRSNYRIVDGQGCRLAVYDFNDTDNNTDDINIDVEKDSINNNNNNDPMHSWKNI